MTHQAKRPYTGSQPSITSYFHVSSPSDQHNLSNKQPHTTSTNETSFPALPSTVQSSLINVGMRVRKSVPEGYKTGTHSAINLFSDAPSFQPATKSPLKTRPRAEARELTPFCGILKVGGMAQQWNIWNPSGSNQSHDDSNYIEEDVEGNDIPFLSSQAGTISSATITTPTRENKRRFIEDDQEYEDETGQFSQRGLCERFIAVPRRKTLGRKVVVANIDTSTYDIDFEDAEFLDYGLVGEVDMS